MGRTPCCSKVGLHKGAWTALEDKILTNYIKIHGEGRWRNVPKEAGLKRCGKSCRLRWINYLRPDIKRGNISLEEEDLILRLHRLLGNRWSLIAGRLPGRTDNEIKNYWNTNLRKKVNSKQSNQSKDEEIKPMTAAAETPPSIIVKPSVIRPKAFKCSKVLVSTPQPHKVETLETKEAAAGENNAAIESNLSDGLLSLTCGADNSSNFSMEFNMGELFPSNLSESDFWEVCEFENVIEEGGTNEPWASWNPCNLENAMEEGNSINGGTNDLPASLDHFLLFLDGMLQD